MKTTGKIERIKPIYAQNIKIPKRFKSFFWDCPDGNVYVEKFILRILNYGDFEDIKYLYKKYPDETNYVAFRYPEIKRGVKFWIKLWKEKE